MLPHVNSCMMPDEPHEDLTRDTTRTTILGAL